jgi:hypothetical protein
MSRVLTSQIDEAKEADESSEDNDVVDGSHVLRVMLRDPRAGFAESHVPLLNATATDTTWCGRNHLYCPTMPHPETIALHCSRNLRFTAYNLWIKS